MAQDSEYLVKFVVDDTGAVGPIDNLGKGLDNINDKQEEVVNSSNNLKKQIKELSRELANVDPNSQKYVDLSQKIGKLKDQVDDAAQSIRANAGNAVENLAGNAGLLGQRLSSLDFGGAASALSGLTSNVKQLDFKALSDGLGSFVKGIGGLGKALLTNPIFLLAAAIGAAVAYSDELLSLVDGVSAADEKQLNAQKEKAALAKEQVDAIGQQEEILKQQGKSEKEITELKLQALDTAIAEQEVTLQTQKNQLVAQVEAAKRNKEFLVGILNFLTAPTKFLLNVVNKILDGANAVGLISDETRANIGDLTGYLDKANESIAGLLFDPAAVQKEGEAALKESEKQLTALKNTKAGIENKINADSTKAATDRANKIKETEDKLNEELAKLAEERRLKALSEQDQELNQANAKFDAMVKEAGNNTDLLAQIETERGIAINEINKKYADEKLEIQRKANAESLKIQQANALELISREEAIAEELRLSKMSAKDKELDALQEKYFEDQNTFAGNAEVLNQLEELYRLKRKEITDKYDSEESAKEQAKADARKEQALKDIQFFADSATSALGSLAEANAQKQEEVSKAISALDKSISEATTKQQRDALIKRRKELDAQNKALFERNKKLQIAQAIVSNSAAIVAAVASQLVPGDPSSVVRATIAGGVIAAQGLVQINKIKNTQYESSAVPETPALSGGGGPNGGATGVPVASPLTTNLLNRPAQPIPAYVLAGEVTGAQDARAKIENLARLTG